MATATVGMRVLEDVSAMSVFGNQSPCGDGVCPAHLWTPRRLVLAVPVCLATSTAQMPGHNRWINTKTRNNYKGLLPFPDKTEQPLSEQSMERRLFFRDAVKHWIRMFLRWETELRSSVKERHWLEFIMAFSVHCQCYVCLLQKVCCLVWNNLEKIDKEILSISTFKVLSCLQRDFASVGYLKSTSVYDRCHCAWRSTLAKVPFEPLNWS